MDLATIIGLLIAVGAITGSFVYEGGSLNSIFMISPMIIVIGGTLGATIITTSFSTVKKIPVFLKLAFVKQTPDYLNTVEYIVTLSEKARREGILGLEPYIKVIKEPFFKKAVQLIIDGTETTTLREILETEIAYLEERHKAGIMFFQKAGGFSPTMGILGTVLALIHTLSNTADSSKMAAGIAAAFIATLWGVGLANLFLLPVSDKLRLRHEDEIAYYEMIMEGMISLQTGDNPRNIKTRLLSFIPPKLRNGRI